MIGAQILGCTAGAALVVWVLVTAIRVVVLPRGARSGLTSAVFAVSGSVLGFFARRTSSYEREDRIRALFAPIALLGVVASWLVLVFVGFAMMFWAFEPDSGANAAFYLSGSSITTLGFGPAETVAEEVLAFIEAGLGLLLLTLLITYLPSIYSAFSRREQKVALLEVRAGVPPSALEFLLRFKRIGWLDRLDDEWMEWEAWFAEVEESHTTYPVLAFFRSPDPHRSWITAAGTVLDTASLHASTLATDVRAPASVCVRAGFIALRKIADFHGIPFDPDPDSSDPISITREEWDAAYDSLEAEGCSLVADRDQAWRDFAGWRVNYDTVLLALAEMVHAPYAPWTADRSPPDHLERRSSWRRMRSPRSSQGA